MNQSKRPSQDDQLAEFADQVLAGMLQETASAADDDLIRLQDTVLRLYRAFPSDSPDRAAAKQMLVRLKARLKREQRTVAPSLWKRLFDFRSNPQFVVAVAAVAALAAAIIAIPVLSSGGAPVTGTALGGSIFVFAGGIGILALIYWFVRRK